MATTDKYDRQLRLWGASGQKALATTHVILLRATAAGTETLKNLILPGIGSFCILDDVHQDVTYNNSNHSDTQYTSNFFLEKSDNVKLMPSRAERACRHLQELNPDVVGSWKHIPDLAQRSGSTESWLTLWNSTVPPPASSDAAGRSLLVIASDAEPALLLSVAKACREAASVKQQQQQQKQQQIPLVVVTQYGLMGLVRLQTPPLALLNPRSSSTRPDLRLTAPFAALVDLYKGMNGVGAVGNLSEASTWETMEKHQHSHIPYPLILLYAMQTYQQAHEGKRPFTFAEKQDFVAHIKSLARNYNDQLNFQEAVQHAYLAYTDTAVLDPEQMQEWKSQASTSAEGGSSSACHELSLLLGGLEGFMKDHDGRLPVQGTVPDMTASTDLYVQLQNVYKKQAETDWQNLRARIPASHVSDETLTSFCHNLTQIRVLRVRSMEQEYNSSSSNPPEELVEALQMAVMEASDDLGSGEGEEAVATHYASPLLWYLTFRGCQAFYQEHGRYPGVLQEEDTAAAGNPSSAAAAWWSFEQDMPAVQAHVEAVVRQYQLSEQPLLQQTLLCKNHKLESLPPPPSQQDQEAGSVGSVSKPVYEMVRWANAEIHNIASLVGGVASQEAVKLVTGQFVPINHTYVFNGIASQGGTYEF